MKTIYTLSFLLLVGFVTAQQPGTFVPKINNIPSSPEAALLGRFGDIPVSHYTGTPNISIPLYTVTEGDIEVPITLNYQASGIKVDDEATWVGLGWSLEPAGSIIQEVRGKQDSEDKMYWNQPYNVDAATYSQFISRLGSGYGSPLLATNYYSVNQFGQCLFAPIIPPYITPYCPGNPTQYDPTDILYRLLEGHGQPDVYHYNFGGYSGSFYKNPQSSQYIFLDSKEGLKFENNWMLTADGTRYEFGAIESSNNGTISEIIGRSLKLTKIRSTDGKEINFIYNDELFQTKLLRSSLVLNPYETDPYNYANSDSFSQGTKKALSQIITPQLIINFNGEARQDFQSNAQNTIKRLQSIDIISRHTNKKIKSFVFGYSYFNPLNSYMYKRLKLDWVKEIGYLDDGLTQDQSKPPHYFYYEESVGLPAKDSFNKDFWGYANNGSGFNNSLIPELDFFDYPQMPQYKTNGQVNFQMSQVYRADRWPDATQAKAAMLKKVVYPTGGYTTYDFEPHMFENQFIPNKQQLQIMRKAPTLNTGPYYTVDATNTLSINQDTTIKVNISFTHGFPQDQSNVPVSGAISGIYYDSYIAINRIVGSQVTELKKWTAADNLMTYQQFAANGKTILDYFTIPYQPGATYVLVSHCPVLPAVHHYGPGMYVQSVGAHVNSIYYDKTLVPNISEQGGFRIRSIKNYTSQDVLALQKDYTYYGGKLLNKFEPLSSEPYMYGKIAHATDPSTGLTSYWGEASFFDRISISSDNFGDNQIGYSYVEEKEVAVNQNNGKKRYYFNNDENQTKPGYPKIQNLWSGLSTREETYNAANDTLFIKKNQYQSIGNYSGYYGIRINSHHIGDTDSYSTIYALPNSIGPFNHKYTYDIYPMPTLYPKVSKTTTWEKFPSGTVINISDFTYNANGLQESVTTTGSDLQTIKTEYQYPQNITNTTEGYMYSANMIGIPLSTLNYKQNSLTLTSKTEFAYDGTTGNRILPKLMYSKKGTQSFDLRCTYVLYDDVGNLLEYKLDNGVPVSIVWGYNNTLPLAKLENVTYSSISSSLLTSIQTNSAVGTYNPTQLNANLASLRTFFPSAMITTYSYKPGVGVSSIIDPKGDMANYTYDAFGRLKEIRDKNGNILSENQYNYRP